MRRQWVRVSCVILMLVVAFASVYRFLAIESQRTLTRAAATAYELLSWTTATSLADLRASQQAYVAAGQDLDTWIESTEEGLEDIAVRVAKLEELSLTPGALEALSDMRATLDRLRSVDEMAREHAIDGQARMASDLVFTDGRDLARGAGSHLELARSLERDAYALQQDDQRQTQVAIVTTASVVALLVAVLLFPATPAKVTSIGMVADLPDSRAEPALELDLGPPEPLPGPTTPEVAAVPSQPESIVPDLKLAAEVCTDLGRLSDGAELSGILARAGQVLNSSGLVVWVRDESGAALRAATGHGYTVNQLSQLGRVSCDSDNVTASAYRTGQLQTVPSEGDLPGAMAVPLLAASKETPSVGVLSVEVAQGWETSEAVQATVSMLAAQLATFVTADPTPASTDVEAADRETHAVG